MLKMKAVLDGKLNGKSFEEYKNSNKGLSFGGFNFTCQINGEEKDVDFDWGSFVANVQPDGTLLLIEGEPAFFGENELDDIYDKEYEKSGFTRSDLTSSVLASTTSINEFTIDYDAEDNQSEDDYLHIQSIVFEDENGEYAVSGEVLDRFNGMEFVEEIHPTEIDLRHAQQDRFFEDYEEELVF